uniref:Uncharacterized protein n=1 Tax=Gopherus evgoodei TaxID=1825980 RepID=A0A8C4XWT2_9SAUR
LRPPLCLALLLPVVAGLDFSYHHSEQLETFLKGVHRQHPSITALRSIGRSVAGRDANFLNAAFSTVYIKPRCNFSFEILL